MMRQREKKRSNVLMTTVDFVLNHARNPIPRIVAAKSPKPAIRTRSKEKSSTKGGLNQKKIDREQERHRGHIVQTLNQDRDE